MSKITKKVALSAAIAALTNTKFETEFSNEEIVAKLAEMQEDVSRKVASKNLDANMKFGAMVLDALATTDRMTYADMREAIPELADFTPQRMTGIIKTIADKVVKTKEKGKTYFALAQ